MKVAVCDDEQMILEEVKGHIEEIAQEMEMIVEIDLFQTIEELEDRIEEAPYYDMIFFDIEIGEENGIYVAAKIKRKYPIVLIAFITGHTQYIKETFDAQPIGFIDKPIQKQAIKHVLEHAKKWYNCLPAFQYSIKGKTKNILVKDICYIASDNRKIIVKTVHGEESYYGRLDDVEKQLQKYQYIFTRISKSYIINWMYVTEITYQDVTLNVMGKREELGISQKYRVKVREISARKLGFL